MALCSVLYKFNSIGWQILKHFFKDQQTLVAFPITLSFVQILYFFFVSYFLPILFFYYFSVFLSSSGNIILYIEYKNTRELSRYECVSYYTLLISFSSYIFYCCCCCYVRNIIWWVKILLIFAVYIPCFHFQSPFIHFEYGWFIWPYR